MTHSRHRGGHRYMYCSNNHIANVIISQQSTNTHVNVTWFDLKFTPLTFLDLPFYREVIWRSREGHFKVTRRLFEDNVKVIWGSHEDHANIIGRWRECHRKVTWRSYGLRIFDLVWPEVIRKGRSRGFHVRLLISWAARTSERTRAELRFF